MLNSRQQSSRLRYNSKGNPYQYRINGYRDVQKKHLNETAQILQIHRLLTDASDLPEITTAPHMGCNLRHMYSYKHMAGQRLPRSAMKTTAACGYKDIPSRAAKAAQNTYRSLRFGNLETDKCTGTAYSKDDPLRSASRASKLKGKKDSLYSCTLPVSPITATATSEYSPDKPVDGDWKQGGCSCTKLKGAKAQCCHHHLPEITTSQHKCQAWLKTCEPWWKVNDEYPTQISNSLVANNRTRTC